MTHNMRINVVRKVSGVVADPKALFRSPPLVDGKGILVPRAILVPLSWCNMARSLSGITVV